MRIKLTLQTCRTPRLIQLCPIRTPSQSLAHGVTIATLWWRCVSHGLSWFLEIKIDKTQTQVKVNIIKSEFNHSETNKGEVNQSESETHEN